ncbi:hypothetical protein SERLA73DRAFT_179378 [Serpula lacrymans var. lacrymans S7.3]|uniref:non-specific serine/threonine protein kinase n=2 Tax=Serpula lacrymans var. lacrymans TaxID=341189 RepID=F8PS63_SERL3|nr:uncharacterized protein SERLADRAFT_464478 [Serpula lacrymans var. lacrymans S7.9]EGO01245.1 hypothetical protein SERLA73DRAFT_179378 [Serpula lacrymans var. lacrymans S7.3]EGO26893.1 hypothetical protein SERLADRAFT_464478 [Serpula lacrymans var. lacrymans S7.9]
MSSSSVLPSSSCLPSQDYLGEYAYTPFSSPSQISSSSMNSSLLSTVSHDDISSGYAASLTLVQSPPFLARTLSQTLPDLCSLKSYRLLGTLGRGTYGKVMLSCFSVNKSPGRQCAMKVLQKRSMTLQRAKGIKGELTVLKSVAEAISLNRRVHKCGFDDESLRGVSFLQNTLACFQDDEFVYMILEYHPISLAHSQAARRLLLVHPPACLNATQDLERTLESFRFLTAELVLGILYLHRLGIVHQDLKPANIMISFHGHAIISDFGAARPLPLLSENDSSGSLISAPDNVQRGPIILPPSESTTFTPLYAAPELFDHQDDGSLIYDERVDFWSLGILLWEIATGDVPYGETADESATESEELVLDFERGEGLDPDLRDFLQQLLGYCVDDRLCGDDAKFHPFFDTIWDLWDDIAMLRYSPLPHPGKSPVINDISLSLDNEVEMKQSTDWDEALLERCLEKRVEVHATERLFEEVDLRVTWPLESDFVGKLALVADQAEQEATLKMFDYGFPDPNPNPEVPTIHDPRNEIPPDNVSKAEALALGRPCAPVTFDGPSVDDLDTLEVEQSNNTLSVASDSHYVTPTVNRDPCQATPDHDRKIRNVCDNRSSLLRDSPLSSYVPSGDERHTERYLHDDYQPTYPYLASRFSSSSSDFYMSSEVFSLVSVIGRRTYDHSSNGFPDTGPNRIDPPKARLRRRLPIFRENIAALHSEPPAPVAADATHTCQDPSDSWTWSFEEKITLAILEALSHRHENEATQQAKSGLPRAFNKGSVRLGQLKDYFSSVVAEKVEKTVKVQRTATIGLKSGVMRSMNLFSKLLG